jgi:hypothetical protein
MINLVSSCWQIRDYKRLNTIQNYIRPSHINLLNPTGHVMHQQFNIQQLYALPTLYLFQPNPAHPVGLHVFFPGNLSVLSGVQ